MAGRIIANTIVAGYPEPGVTADEIVGMVNKYGLPLSGYTGVTSKTYSATELKQLVNSSPSTPPAIASLGVDIEAWPMDSNVLVSVAVNSVLLTLTDPQQDADDTTYAGVSVLIGDDPTDAYGTIGQSARNGTDTVAFHGQYECFKIAKIPAGQSLSISGVFSISGSNVGVNVESGGYYANISVKVMRVLS